MPLKSMEPAMTCCMAACVAGAATAVSTLPAYSGCAANHAGYPCTMPMTPAVSASVLMVGCTPSKLMSSPLKSRFSLLTSMALGSMLMEDASKAGKLERSRFIPDKSMLAPRSAPCSPAASALSSNVKALCSFCPSMVNRLDISKPLPFFWLLSSSANDLPVITFVAGFAFWSCTIWVFPAWSIRWFTKLEG